MKNIFLNEPILNRTQYLINKLTSLTYLYKLISDQYTKIFITLNELGYAFHDIAYPTSETYIEVGYTKKQWIVKTEKNKILVDKLTMHRNKLMLIEHAITRYSDQWREVQNKKIL